MFMMYTSPAFVAAVAVDITGKTRLAEKRRIRKHFEFMMAATVNRYPLLDIRILSSRQTCQHFCSSKLLKLAPISIGPSKSKDFHLEVPPEYHPIPTVRRGSIDN
jgi:hypothetical protein